MTSLYRIAAMVIGVFALWSIILVGFFSSTPVPYPNETLVNDIGIIQNIENKPPPLDIVTTNSILNNFEQRIESNTSVVLTNDLIKKLPQIEIVKEIVPPIVEKVEEAEVVEIATEIKEIKPIVSSAYILPVPFISQAPEGNWGEPWQETCEEASLVMAVHYFNKTPITVDTAIDEIFTLVEYQTDLGLTYHDGTMQQTAAMGSAIHNLITEVIENPTIEDIIAELSKGNLVITPFAGRLLGNKFFTPPGPRYHVNVIIGFDNATGEFITNDPGTRFGGGYRYTYDTIMNAMHDWTGNAAMIEQGAKRILVVKGIDNENNSN